MRLPSATVAALSTRLTNLAAFLLPALALWVPSGYSYSALLLVFGALIFSPLWLQQKPERATAGLALLLAGMGVMWFGMSLDSGWARWDKGAKWFLGALCLLYITAFPPRPKAFVAGLPIGCAGMGILALWQVWGQELERAAGYTNAIQWGNLALLLACLTAVPLMLFWHRHGWPWRLWMGLAVALGTTASLLSQSRGGWLAIGAVFLLWLALAWRIRPQLLPRFLVVLSLLLVAGTLVLAFTPRLKERVDLAAAEISGYLKSGDESTSLGLRLAQYGLVTELIPQKPWLGWGAHGYVQEVQRRVDTGEYGPEMLRYPEVHNDFLDVWVKVGLGGVLLQGALFAWVLAMFWPSHKRLARWAPDSPPWRNALALRVMGLVVPVSYLVFGLSQPFFNHNNGIMCFIFLTIVLWATLKGVELEGP